MKVKCLSVRNPVSYHICTGLKDVENRSWSTPYRGRLYIHSSGAKDYDIFDIESFPDSVWRKYQTVIYDKKTDAYGKKIISVMDSIAKFYGVEKFIDLTDDDTIKYHKAGRRMYCVAEAIIGHVELADIIRDSKSLWSEPKCCHWILKNPVLFDKPIQGIKGKLRLYDVEI